VPVNEAILGALSKVLPSQGMVLELGSGVGERVVELARAFPHLAWQPTERDPQATIALARRRDEAGLQNLLRPIELAVELQPWPVAQVDAIVSFDYAHLAPWDRVAAAFGGGARALAANGLFFLCGPFRFHGKFAAKELEELDLRLRARDPALGVRDVRELTVAGTRTGLGLEHALAMPEARHALVFRRRPLLPPTGQFHIG
jgi:hypothetical protein